MIKLKTKKTELFDLRSQMDALKGTILNPELILDWVNQKHPTARVVWINNNRIEVDTSKYDYQYTAFENGIYCYQTDGKHKGYLANSKYYFFEVDLSNT